MQEREHTHVKGVCLRRRFLEQTIAQFDDTGEAATEKVLVVERQKEKRQKLLNRTLAT